MHTHTYTQNPYSIATTMALRGGVVLPGGGLHFAAAQPVDLTLAATVLATTGENYICATSDWWPKNKCDYGVCAWSEAPWGGNPSIPELDLTQPLFKAAFDELSPFIWRLGGSMQDDITYEEPANKGVACPPITDDPDAQWGFTGGCLTRDRWQEVAEFAQTHKAQLVFGLNELKGRTHVQGKEWTGDWDPSNAKSLLTYTKEKGLPVYAWELGNELGGWNGIQAQLTAQEIGKDFLTLKEMVTDLWGEGEEAPLVVGPDTGFDLEWFTEFFQTVKGKIDGVAIHMYALGAGVDPGLLGKIMSPAHMQTAMETATNLSQLTKDLLGGSLDDGQGTPQMWMGEDGGAYNSGQNGTTNRFTAGFWSLNELGIFARAGFSVYCRQTLLGGNYGLLDKDTLKPNPDFFNYVLFKRLMGPKVLDVQGAGGDLTAYAHCTREGAVPGQRPGAVTLLLINFAENDVQLNSFKVGDAGGKDLLARGSPRLDYTLTPGTAGVLNSTFPNLNGKPLQVSADAVYPSLKPKAAAEAGDLVVPKTAYGFYVFPKAGLEACK